jgi:amino acid transporter
LPPISCVCGRYPILGPRKEDQRRRVVVSSPDSGFQVSGAHALLLSFASSSIIIVVIVAINILGVAFFGEIEFWMSTCKVLVLVGLLLLGIILDLGGGPTHDRIGFRYWKSTLS